MKYSSRIESVPYTIQPEDLPEYIRQNFPGNKTLVVDIRTREELHNEITIEACRMLYWEHIVSIRFGNNWIKVIYDPDPDDHKQREVLIELGMGEDPHIIEDKMVDITELVQPSAPF